MWPEAGAPTSAKVRAISAAAAVMLGALSASAFAMAWGAHDRLTRGDPTLADPTSVASLAAEGGRNQALGIGLGIAAVAGAGLALGTLAMGGSSAAPAVSFVPLPSGGAFAVQGVFP